MTLNFNQLRQANAARGVEWMGKTTGPEDVEFCALELGGEVGEVLNDVKKFARFVRGVTGGVAYDESRDNIAQELADVIICVDRVAEAMRIDLGQAVRDKFNATSVKHSLKTLL